MPNQMSDESLHIDWTAVQARDLQARTSGVRSRSLVSDPRQKAHPLSSSMTTCITRPLHLRELLLFRNRPAAPVREHNDVPPVIFAQNRTGLTTGRDQLLMNHVSVFTAAVVTRDGLLAN